MADINYSFMKRHVLGQKNEKDISLEQFWKRMNQHALLFRLQIYHTRITCTTKRFPDKRLHKDTCVCGVCLLYHYSDWKRIQKLTC